MPDDAQLLLAEMPSEVDDVLRQLVEIVGLHAARLPAHAIAALVGRDHAKARLCEIGHLVPPAEAIVGKAM